MRLLALTPDSDAWTIWVDGFREILARLEAGDRPGAVESHRLIYVRARAVLRTMTFDET